MGSNFLERDKEKLILHLYIIEEAFENWREFCGVDSSIFSSHVNCGLSSCRHLFGSVNIGDDVIVYPNLVIGPGVNIGNSAVIAAGLVIILVGGLPQRSLRKMSMRAV